ncbi:MAG: S8 family serine peptidase [Nitrospinota bacterium]
MNRYGLLRVCRVFCGILTLLFIISFSSIAYAVIDHAGKNSVSVVTDGEFVPDEVIVTFRSGLKGLSTDSIHSRTGTRSIRNISRINAQLVKIESGATLEETIALYNKDPNVEFVQPNFIYHASLIPNDPSLPWGIKKISGPQAWDIETGGDIIVAVIDTGVAYNHVDLAGNIWKNSGEIPGNFIDDDGNGYVDDVRGWNFVAGNNNPWDNNGHGTHVSGTIAAVGNNSIGVVGVNWRVRIMPLKFLDARGSGTTADAIRAIYYAANNGAKISNNSWGGAFDSGEKINARGRNPGGGGGFDLALYNAIAYAGNHGALFVAAAGNDSKNTDGTPSYPASFDLPNIISVAATDSNDNKASFSNWGYYSVDLGAPGVKILSTIPNNGYSSAFSGTSMASPHVAGASALIWAAFPSLTHIQVKKLVVFKTDPVPSLNGLVLSGGRLNVAKAISWPEDGIVDSPDPNFSVQGTWDSSSSRTSAFYSINYVYSKAGTGADTATWDAELTDGPGLYEVFVWYPSFSALATNAPFTINHAGISDTVPVDQCKNGGQWVSLGAYEFNDDGTENVTLSDNANSWVVADAVRFAPRDGIVDNTDPGFSLSGVWRRYDAAPNISGYGTNLRYHAAGNGIDTATWSAELSDGAGLYEVFVWHPICSKLATNAPFTINHKGRSDIVMVDQSVNGGQWVSLGVYEFADDDTENIILSDEANSWVVADAVRFLPASR